MVAKNGFVYFIFKRKIQSNSKNRNNLSPWSPNILLFLLYIDSEICDCTFWLSCAILVSDKKQAKHFLVDDISRISKEDKFANLLFVLYGVQFSPRMKSRCNTLFKILLYIYEPLLKFPTGSVEQSLSVFPSLVLHCEPSSIFSFLIKGSKHTVIELGYFDSVICWKRTFCYTSIWQSFTDLFPNSIIWVHRKLHSFPHTAPFQGQGFRRLSC